LKYRILWIHALMHLYFIYHHIMNTAIIVIIILHFVINIVVDSSILWYVLLLGKCGSWHCIVTCPWALYPSRWRWHHLSHCEEPLTQGCSVTSQKTGILNQITVKTFKLATLLLLFCRVIGTQHVILHCPLTYKLCLKMNMKSLNLISLL
jgi:hypothetical protein